MLNLMCATALAIGIAEDGLASGPISLRQRWVSESEPQQVAASLALTVRSRDLDGVGELLSRLLAGGGVAAQPGGGWSPSPKLARMAMSAEAPTLDPGEGSVQVSVQVAFALAASTIAEPAMTAPSAV